MASAAQQTTQLLLVAGLAAACCWAALTTSGQAWARRVWEGDREGARRRKAAKQLRFLEARLGELARRVEVSVGVGVDGCGWCVWMVVACWAVEGGARLSVRYV